MAKTKVLDLSLLRFEFGLERKAVHAGLGRWFASDGDNYHKMQMAAAQLGADAVIVHGQDAQGQRDYWQYPKTSGVAIKYTDLSGVH